MNPAHKEELQPQFYLSAPGNSGTVYIDSAQLELSDTPSRYNMLQNSDLSNGTTDYDYNYADANARIDLTNAAYSEYAPSHPDYLSSGAFLFARQLKSCHLQQTITVDGRAGDVYSFGAWVCSDNIPESTQWFSYKSSAGNWLLHQLAVSQKRLTVEFLNSNKDVRSSVSIAFPADTEEWQFSSGSAVATTSYSFIRIKMTVVRTQGNVLVDGLQLYRETFSQGYTYDSSGNLTGYTSLLGQQNAFSYDANDNLTGSTDALGNTAAYTYDSKHNLLTATSEEGVVTANTYDANGNVTETTVGSSTGFIRSQTAYDSASALVTAVTDARGNSAQYAYNSATRQQTAITDAKGNESSYSYGDAAGMLRLASLTSDGTGTVSYAYDTNGKLTDISRGTTFYSFTYDSWNRVADTKVGTATLSTNAYDQYGRLTSVTYGSGFRTEYTYDSLDRVAAISQRADTSSASLPAYAFTYNGEGDLYALYNYKTDRVAFFTYDHGGRCMASTEKTFTHTAGAFAVLTAGSVVSSYAYKYDALNRLSKLTCSVMGTSYSTVYTYDGDGRPLTTTLSNGKTVTNTYDAMGRLTQKRLGLTANYDAALTYLAGASGSQTALLATYKNGSDARYNYAYDANGNITQSWRGSVTFANATEKYAYEYDSANQLVRENLYYGSGNSNNATYTYEYDSWGNLLNKYTYTYTTGSLTGSAPSNPGTPPTATTGVNVYLTDGDGTHWRVVYSTSTIRREHQFTHWKTQLRPTQPDMRIIHPEWHICT